MDCLTDNERELPVVREIIEELTDPGFRTRTHGRRKTYADGCHGPLCRKAERDRGLPRYREQQEEAGRTVVPKPPSPARRWDPLLDKVMLWHVEARATKTEGG